MLDPNVRQPVRRQTLIGAAGIAALYTLTDLRAPPRAGSDRSPAMPAQTAPEPSGNADQVALARHSRESGNPVSLSFKESESLDPRFCGDDGTCSALPSRDFDFLHGRWLVRNRRLRERLVGCNDWDSFDGVQVCRPILGGFGNEDELVSDAFGERRFIGMTIRLFDPRAREWSIYWVDNRSMQMQPPVRGRFERGIGTFHGHDAHAGMPVLARFIWTPIDDDHARWEQAFSTDDGASWETNWIMEFERRSA